MKKGLMTLSAFVFAMALAGCGADKEKAPDKDSSSSAAEATTAVETTTAEETTGTEKETDSKDEKDGDKDEKDGSSETSAAELTLNDIAGPYHKTGYLAMGNYPEELDPKKLVEIMKEDPMTISEDGILHFCGKDYKLGRAGAKDEETVFGIEGSGFDMKEYVGSSVCGSKDYEGPCMFVCNTLYMTLNDEKFPYTEYKVILKAKGSDSSFGYISVDQGEADDWDSWTWDDEDTTVEE